MTFTRYIKDIHDGLRLEIPYKTENGEVHLEHEALVYQWDGSHDVTEWQPLCELLSQSEIEELKEEIRNEN